MKHAPEDDQDPTLPLKNQRSLAKQLSDKERDRTWIKTGLAFLRWRAMTELNGCLQTGQVGGGGAESRG